MIQHAHYVRLALTLLGLVTLRASNVLVVAPAQQEALLIPQSAIALLVTMAPPQLAAPSAPPTPTHPRGPQLLWGAGALQGMSARTPRSLESPCSWTSSIPQPPPLQLHC